MAVTGKMRKILTSKKFSKDLTRMQKRRANINLFQNLLHRVRKKEFNVKDRDHALKGDFIGYRECHIKGDWILVYREVDENTVELYRTGTHQDIFRKQY